MSGCMQSTHAQIASMSGGMLQGNALRTGMSGCMKSAYSVCKHVSRHGIESMYCAQACQVACKERMHRLQACQDAWYIEHAKRACTVCKHVRRHATGICTAHRHVRVHEKRVFTVCKHVRRHDVANMHCAQACQVIRKARMQSLQACQEAWNREHTLRTGVSGCMQRAHAQIASMPGGMG
jgi:hypothetical protein